MTKAESPKPLTKLETVTLKVYIHCEGCRRKVRRIIRVLDGVEDVTVDSASGKVTVTGTADVKTILQRLQKYGKHAEVWPSANPAPPTAGKAGANQPKQNNNNGSDSNNKKKNNAGGMEGGDKAAAAAAEHGSKKGDGKEATPGAAAKGELEAVVNESKPEKSKEANPEVANNAKAPTQNGGGGGGGKKGGKKGGNGNNTNNNANSSNNSGGGTGNVLEVPSLGPPAHDIPIMNAPNTSVVVSANKSLAPYDSIQTGYTYHSAEYATHMFSDENANNCSIM